MNLLKPIAAKMEYIQKVFLRVQDYMQRNHVQEDLISFLDSEPPEFRSVAYEAASFEMALNDLLEDNELNNWKVFYNRSSKAHTFHMDIGLGWAFAKNDISPTPYLGSLTVMSSMVFDGIGYYYGLFKGRKTVKSGLVPEGVSAPDLYGFDQGLGRRLWYISKGEVTELIKLLQVFQPSRHADLWRGVGIACGYVGGNDTSNLGQLLKGSNEFKDQLCAGIALAAISRNASCSVTSDLELACTIVCGITPTNVLNSEPWLRKESR